VSMPGMMDTILNLGMNDKTAENMVKIFENENFVYDLYFRFIQMFSEIVMGVEKELFFELRKKLKGRVSNQELINRAKIMYWEETGKFFPESAKEQLFMAINSIFKSWENERAKVYRRINRIDDSMGTAVVVQEMVFGNLNEKSGTGVAFTRNPSTGEKHVFGEYLLKAQGEDIVAGIRTPEPIDRLKEELPYVYEEFLKIADILEKHNKDMQDIEFTIEDGKLFLLQTRNGKRSPYAAIKIAVDMVKEGLLTKEEAIMKVDPAVLPQLLHGNFEPAALKNATLLGKGLAGSAGVAIGRVVFASERVHTKEMTILVREETSPEDIKGISLAQGIVTVKGGATSHGAVVARGMGKCCVTGCGDIKIDDIRREMTINGYTVKEGEFISISGYTGEIYLGKVGLTKPQFDDNLKEFVSWCKEIKRLGIRINADTVTDAQLGKGFGAEGIGLCRTEHMFFQKDKIWTIRGMILSHDTDEVARALEKMHQLQREDFYNIFKVVENDVVIVRLLDPPLHEFLPHTDEEIRPLAESLGMTFDALKARVESLKEFNPMMGHRGCRLAVTYPEIAEMQTRAVIEAAIAVNKEGQNVVPEIMIPLVGDIKELKYVKDVVCKTADAIIEEAGVELPYKVGTMIEIPRAALTADEIAKEAEFFSFGTNDLTQMTYGFSRDDAAKFLNEYYTKNIFESDPFAHIDENGVGQLMQIAINKAKPVRPDIKLGICGEHGGDPRTVEFCHRIGLTYVSCSPYRVPLARLAAAQAAVKEKMGK